MKIGIIVCDKVAPALAAEFGEFADMISASLNPYGQFEYRLFDAITQDLPNNQDDCQGYIITGSTHDAYVDKPWINHLADWIRQIDEQRKPLIGICFGHQIICVALGGQVEKSPKGWGLGMSTNQIYSHLPWMIPKKEHVNILVSHQDQVTQIPPGMTLIASNNFCPNYMLIKDNHILTVQGHPEFSMTFERRLLERKKALLTENQYQQALSSLDSIADSAIAMQWFALFFQGHSACPA
jgi:GMP synthase-like glutamine amidotransferase